MSQDEEAMVYGRTLSEYAEVKKRLALLLAQADRVAVDLQKVLSFMKAAEYRELSALASGDNPPDLGSFPPREDLQALFSEIRVTVRRRKELHAQLKSFGVEPKD